MFIYIEFILFSGWKVQKMEKVFTNLMMAADMKETGSKIIKMVLDYLFM